MFKQWITESTPVIYEERDMPMQEHPAWQHSAWNVKAWNRPAPGLSGQRLPPLDQRPTPSAVPDSPVPKEAKTPTPSATYRAFTPTPVIRDRNQLQQLSAAGQDEASSILPRMSGNGKSAEFDDLE